MKKLTLTIVSILSVVAIFGVGFAAWVIINPSVEAPADGTIAVEEVTDKSYKLTATAAGEISFGFPASATTGWLRADKADKTEKLTATLTLTLTYKDWAYVPETLNLSIATRSTVDPANDTEAAANFAKIATVENNKLVSNVVKVSYASSESGLSATINGEGSTAAVKTASFSKTSETEDTTTEKTATLEVTLTFDWGSYFTKDGKVVNPYEFYKETYTEALALDAKTRLGDIKTNLTNVGYKVTIKGTTANA